MQVFTLFMNGTVCEWSGKNRDSSIQLANAAMANDAIAAWIVEQGKVIWLEAANEPSGSGGGREQGQ